MIEGQNGTDPTATELVLASRSATRRAMLEQAGFSFRVAPAECDERAIEAGLGRASPGEVAAALAGAKAAQVSASEPMAWVIGSDSLVDFEGKRFDKPSSRKEAEEHLSFFSGRTIALWSAAALARHGSVEWSYTEMAELRVRDLSSAFIARYLDAEWPAIGACAGCFRIEGLGINLFSSIGGNHFTILGMPLLPLLGELRRAGLNPTALSGT